MVKYKGLWTWCCMHLPNERVQWVVLTLNFLHATLAGNHNENKAIIFCSRVSLDICLFLLLIAIHVIASIKHMISLWLDPHWLFPFDFVVGEIKLNTCTLT